MNVCLISREYPPFFGGGIGAYTVRWSRTLAAAGHRVVVVTVSDDGREGRERDGDVEVVRLPFIRGSGHTGDWSGPHPLIASPETRAAFATFSPVAVFSMQIAAALPRLVEEFGIQVVEAPDTGALAWFALNDRQTGAAWHDGDGPAFVTCIHSPTEWIAQWNRTRLEGRRDTELVWMERDGAAWSDGLVSPSAEMARWVAERWGERGSRIEVIPYPLGELEERARAAAGHGSESGVGFEGAGRVLFAGRLEPRKGVRVLLEGFALAVQGGVELELDLVGEDMPEGTSGHGVRLIGSLPEGVRRRVHTRGRVEPIRLAQMRARARIVVVPSPMDNFPNTCVEAMAHGRVVVAARAGGMAEMIRDGVDGLVFEPEDASACAAALSRAASLSAQQAAELGRSAARRMLELCGNAGVTAMRLAHYERAITARPRANPGAGDFVVIARGGASGTQVGRLKSAAARAGAGFAHGWTRTSGQWVRVYATPRVETLSVADREIGALVADRAAARKAALKPGMTPWEAAIALARSSVRGIVVPEVVAPDAAGGRIQRLLRAFRGV